MTHSPVLAWLLAGDPAIRFQVRRDLLDEPARRWRRDQELVAREGWGARLLAERAEARAREFFCAHRLYRSHRTGAVVDAKMTRLTFPSGWRHDVLRALDYFQSAGAKRDPRLGDPIALLRAKRGEDGRWPAQGRQAGKVWFELERNGRPSRWNTLRALRVLKWWEGR